MKRWPSSTRWQRNEPLLREAIAAIASEHGNPFAKIAKRKPAGLNAVDLEALERAIELARQESRGRRDQVDSMLKERDWQEVAEFCARPRNFGPQISPCSAAGPSFACCARPPWPR